MRCAGCSCVCSLTAHPHALPTGPSPEHPRFRRVCRYPEVHPVTMREFLHRNPDIAQAAWLPWERKFSKPA